MTERTSERPADRYRIERPLGQGGMGVVYAATDLQLGRTVALKVVSAQFDSSEVFLSRFDREAQLLARIDSPHVIRILDYGDLDGRPYIATQYVPGGDLGNLLRTRGPMPTGYASRVCAQVADALADAHRAGVVHRDVKPGNVLLRDPESDHLHAYLCDFGVARTAADGVTQVGIVVGTWAYLAPEVGDGQEATPQSDIYALGCLLWATLTGQAPYLGSTVEIALAHRSAPIPQLVADTEVADRLNRILTGCMAKDPRQRYAGADALRSDLEAVARMVPVHVRPVAPGKPARKRGPRRRTKVWPWIAAGTAACVFTGVGIGVVAAEPWASDGPPAADPDPTEPTTDAPAPPPTAPAPTGEKPITFDLDGDGYGDFRVTVGDPQTMQLVTTGWRSTGLAFEEQPDKHAYNARETGLQEEHLGDFDGDKRQEIIRVYQDGGRMWGTLSGGGELDSRVEVPDVPKIPGEPGVRELSGEFGDLDGDGRTDVLWISYVEIEGDPKKNDDDSDVGPLHFWVSHSTGTGFSAPEPMRGPGGAPLVHEMLPGQKALQFALADLDGNGRDDIVIHSDPDKVGRVRQHVEAYLVDDGGAATQRVPTLDYNGAEPWRLIRANLDGDADDELVTIEMEGNNFDGAIAPLRLLDLVDGSFARPAAHGVFRHRPGEESGSYFGVSDVNGDGRDDVVATVVEHGVPGSTVQVALSDGTGWAAPVVWADWAESPSPYSGVAWIPGTERP